MWPLGQRAWAHHRRFINNERAVAGWQRWWHAARTPHPYLLLAGVMKDDISRWLRHYRNEVLIYLMESSVRMTDNQRKRLTLRLHWQNQIRGKRLWLSSLNDECHWKNSVVQSRCVNSDEKLLIGQSQRAVMKSTWKQKRHWIDWITQSQDGEYVFSSNTDQMGPALFYS